jgi:hypothetical protein
VEGRLRAPPEAHVRELEDDEEDDEDEDGG